MQPESANYFFPSYYSCFDADVTLCSDDSEQAEPTSSEFTALVWILCYPVGPQLEDTLHALSMSAEELNSNQASPQMGPESVSELDVYCTAPSQKLGKLQAGDPAQRHVSPQLGAPVGCFVYAKYIFFKQINLMAKIPS